MFTQFKHPFTMIVAGPSGSGKTTFTTTLLENLIVYVHPRIQRIIWCYAESNAIPERVKTQLNTPISFHQGIPEKFENPLNVPTLIILDDLMQEANSTRVCELFTKGSHHRNLSVILITQNFFHQGSRCRDISLNAKYVVIFKNPRDKLQFQYLARQIHPENPKEMLRIYKEATEKPHGYLLLDLTQDAHHLLRYRTNIFDHCIVYCEKPTAPSDNVQIETFNGEQAYAIRP